MSLDLTRLKRGGCWREARLFYRRRLSVQIFVKRTDGFQRLEDRSWLPESDDAQKASAYRNPTSTPENHRK
jgi:hypothetical protein